MKALLTVDSSGVEELIGPFTSNTEATDWANKELPFTTDYEIRDLTEPKGVSIPGTISIDLETLKMLDLSPLLGKDSG